MNKFKITILLFCIFLFCSCNPVNTKPQVLKITEDNPEAIIKKGKPFTAPCDGRFLSNKFYKDVTKMLKFLSFENTRLQNENRRLKKNHFSISPGLKMVKK